tara:strand:+ start:199 stop:2673 length:2475 start_codon:yes stop_codon:yes gene_type:complete
VPKVSTAFANFTAGEITPKLFGRTDISKYDNGAETVENFLVQPHGGLMRRPGTRFVSEVKNSSNAVRLIPFEFNVEQSYILEFGPTYFRVYKDGGQVESGGSAVEVTTVYTASDLDGLKFAQAADTMYIVSPNHPIYKITRTSHTAWTITEVTTQRGPFLDQNITTTTLTPDSRDGTIRLTASADLWTANDVGRLVKIEDGFVKITSRVSATVADGTAQELEDGRSEILPNYAAATISFHEGDPDATGLEHNDRIEDTAAAFIDQGFKVGQTIIISGSTSNNTTDGHLVVDVTDSVITLAPGADLATEAADSGHTLQGKLVATDEWSLGAFSKATGYPRAVAFYEQRLVFAGTSEQPQTLFFSQGGDFENFESGTSADDGMVYTIGSNQVNVIRFLASTRNLIVGTSGGEFVVRASGADEAITPTNIQIKQQTSHGSADITPMQAGNAVLFVQRAKRKVLELQFNFDVDGYIAPDVALISEHITENGLDELAYQQEPDSVLWGRRGDGQLACMTYKREEQVIGWSRQILGGVFGTGIAVVESIATIPGDLDEDQVWVVVKRTIGGATKRYIEFIKDFDFGTDVNNAIFVDSSLTFTGVTSTLAGAEAADQTTITLADASSFPSSGAIKIGTEVITYSGKSTNDLTGCSRGVVGDPAAHSSGATVTQATLSLSGLNHLEGQTVSILGDGSVHPDKTVSSGAVTLERYVTKAHAGLSYNSTLRTLRVDAGSAMGTSQGKIKRINELTVRLYRSVGLKVGRDASNLDIVPFRSSAASMDAPISLFTGDKEIELNGNYDTDGQLTIRQDQPLPMNILAVFATLSTFDQ